MLPIRLSMVSASRRSARRWQTSTSLASPQSAPLQCCGRGSAPRKNLRVRTSSASRRSIRRSTPTFTSIPSTRWLQRAPKTKAATLVWRASRSHTRICSRRRACRPRQARRSSRASFRWKMPMSWLVAMRLGSSVSARRTSTSLRWAPRPSTRPMARHAIRGTRRACPAARRVALPQSSQQGLLRGRSVPIRVARFDSPPPSVASLD